MSAGPAVRSDSHEQQTSTGTLFADYWNFHCPMDGMRQLTLKPVANSFVVLAVIPGCCAAGAGATQLMRERIIQHAAS